MLRVSFRKKNVPRLSHGRKTVVGAVVGISTKNVGGSSGLLLVMRIFL